MDTFTSISLLFTYLLFTAVHLRKKMFRKLFLFQMITVILLSFSFIIIGLSFSLEAFLEFSVILYLLLIGIAYSSEILPALNEEILLIVSVIYTYRLFLIFPAFDINKVILPSVPVVMSFFYCYSQYRITKFQKIFSYVLLLVMLSVIEYYNLDESGFFSSRYTMPERLNYSFFSSVFFTGGILFYLSIYMFNLIQIIPVMGRGETDDKFKARLKERSELFISKFNDRQANRLKTSLIGFILGIFLILNFRFRFLAANVITEDLLGLVIIISQVKFIMFKKSDESISSRQKIKPDKNHPAKQKG